MLGSFGIQRRADSIPLSPHHATAQLSIEWLCHTHHCEDHHRRWSLDPTNVWSCDSKQWMGTTRWNENKEHDSGALTERRRWFNNEFFGKKQEEDSNNNSSNVVWTQMVAGVLFRKEKKRRMLPRMQTIIAVSSLYYYMVQHCPSQTSFNVQQELTRIEQQQQQDKPGPTNHSNNSLSQHRSSPTNRWFSFWNGSCSSSSSSSCTFCHKTKTISLLGGAALFSAVKVQPAKEGKRAVDYFWIGAFGQWFFVGSL